MIFYRLGIFFLFHSYKFENEQEKSHTSYPNIVCETDLYKVEYCYTDTNSSKHLPTLPIDTIPFEVKVIYLHLPKRTGWQINDHTMFHRFKDLIEIRLEGPVHFSHTYDDPIMKSRLTNQLFELPNLTIAALHGWKLDDSFVWKFPHNLESLLLTKCNRSQFDLLSYPNLVQVDFRWNRLKKMPRLSTPPPPLHFLSLSYNPDIEFDVFDIVGLCQLRSLSINVFNAGFNKTRKYCECKRLEKYMKEFDISPYDKFQCDKLQTDCNDYSLEEVKKIREKECPTKNNGRGVIETKSSQETLIIVCLILAVVVALIFLTFSLILFLKQ